MKKILIRIFITLIVTALAVGPASAQAGTIYIKGDVVSVADGTLIVKSNQNEFVVTVPHGFDIDSIEVGDTVLITGRSTGSGLLEADFLSLAAAGNNDGLPEGSKDNTAYCEANAEPHPLVASLAERHDVSQDEVSQYFCNGFSIEAIMMALMTSEIEIDGQYPDPAALLALLADGYSWSQVWETINLTDYDQSEPNLPEAVSEPEPTPTEVVSEPQPTPTEVVSEPASSPTEVVVSEPQPTPTEVVAEPDPSPSTKPDKPDKPDKPTKKPSKSPVDEDNDEDNDDKKDVD